MKSAMPYYGVRMPEVRKRVRARLRRRSGSTSAPPGRRPIRALYDEATHREERYAALALAAHRLLPRVGARAPAALGLYEHLIRDGRLVGPRRRDLASRRRRPARASRRGRRRRSATGRRRDDLWVRRSSIICQIGHKAETDLDLLTRRDRAQHRRPRLLHPQGDRLGAARGRRRRPAVGSTSSSSPIPDLSPLSVREATKHIGPPPPSAVEPFESDRGSLDSPPLVWRIDDRPDAGDVPEPRRSPAGRRPGLDRPARPLVGRRAAPTAILVISAHWEEAPLTVGATTTVPLTYDFWGFPQHYYEVHVRRTRAHPSSPTRSASCCHTPQHSVHDAPEPRPRPRRLRARWWRCSRTPTSRCCRSRCRPSTRWRCSRSAASCARCATRAC